MAELVFMVEFRCELIDDAEHGLAPPLMSQCMRCITHKESGTLAGIGCRVDEVSGWS